MCNGRADVIFCTGYFVFIVLTINYTFGHQVLLQLFNLPTLFGYRIIAFFYGISHVSLVLSLLDFESPILIDMYHYTRYLAMEHGHPTAPTASSLESRGGAMIFWKAKARALHDVSVMPTEYKSQ